MKRFLLITIHSVLLLNLKSQVVFCPPGAQWNYSFVNIPAWYGNYVYANEQITYVKDTVISGDSAKVLQHKRYYNSCYSGGYFTVQTYIRQNGDTVFFRNTRTQNSWQILINYACIAGDSWQTTILKANSTPITYTYTVDSIGQTVENGFSLRTLYLKQNATAVERFGWQSFLFNYFSYANGCDGYYFADFLCYSDSTFGVKQFTDHGCYFSGSFNINSIEEQKDKNHLVLYPNPVKDKLSITGLHSKTNSLAILTDFTGRQLKTISVSENAELNLSDIPCGMYLLQIKQSGNLLIQRKIIKE